MTSTDTDTEYYMTRAYACGRVFYSRVFGTLTTSVVTFILYNNNIYAQKSGFRC